MSIRNDKFVITLGFLISIAGIIIGSLAVGWLSDHPKSPGEAESWVLLIAFLGAGMIFGGMIMVFHRIGQGIPD